MKQLDSAEGHVFV